MSFRLKLILWNTLVVLALLFTAGGVLVWQTQSIFLQSIDRDLIQRSNRSPMFTPGPPDGGPDPGNRGPQRGGRPGDGPQEGGPRGMGPNGGGQAPRVPDHARDDIRRPAPFDTNGQPMLQNDTRMLDAESLKRRDIREPILKTLNHNGIRIRVATVPIWREGELRGFVQVGHEMLDYDRLRTTQYTVALLLVPFVLLTTGLLGAFLASRALRPVKEVADAAERMTSKDLNTRLEVHGNDELGRLSASFNSMLERLHGSFEERTTLIRELEASLERQRRFVADASHELRTPLARLRLVTSSALTQDSTEAELKRALELSDQAGVSMTTLVEQLLALARIEGQTESQEVSALKDVLIEATAPYGSRLTGSEFPSATVRGRQADLVRAITNLIDNAVRHTAPENEIRVAAARQGEFCIVNVSDAGSGIAAEHLSRLGERFYRVDEARNRKDGGSGLGLSIVKSIVEQCGGMVKFESQVGIGTSVTLFLPIA